MMSHLSERVDAAGRRQEGREEGNRRVGYVVDYNCSISPSRLQEKGGERPWGKGVVGQH